MSLALVDAGIQLIPFGTTITANATYTAVALAVRRLPTCAWVVALSQLAAPTQDLTLILEVGSTSGGAFSEVSRLVIPQAGALTNYVAGLNGAVCAVINPSAQWLRARVIFGGTGSYSIGSFLTKPANLPGIGKRPIDTAINAP
jgi:hypothetical protein